MFYFKELITRYAQELSLSEETVTNAIEHLRLHALEKLAARQKLQESGLATFKIKLAGNVPTEVRKTDIQTCMVVAR